MSDQLRIGFALAGASFLLFGACSTVPETGRSRLLLTSPAMEAEQGQLAFQEVKRSQKVSTNTAANAQVKRVGKRLVSVVDAPGNDWEFVVFEDKTPNAFALPGGKIGVNTGLLPLTRTDAGLAVVIGHEIGHVVARHGGERMSHSALTSIGGTALDVGLGVGTGLGGLERSVLLGAYGIGSQVGVMLPYSRTHEYEADKLGLFYMARAGYDPREALAFWKRMAEASKEHGGGIPEFLSTHPVDSNRIRHLEKHMPAALAEYEKAKGRSAR